jgi:hypothetical protein
VAISSSIVSAAEKERQPGPLHTITISKQQPDGSAIAGHPMFLRRDVQQTYPKY